MSTVHAIFEKGVFRPTEPVELPENCQVEFEPRVIQDQQDSDMAEIFENLPHRYDTGIPDLAARHNEHQP